MLRSGLLILTLVSGALPSLAQKQPIDRYVRDLGADYTDVATKNPGERTDADLKKILPLQRSQNFAEYVASKNSAVDLFTLMDAVEIVRMDKQVGSAGGASGVTSLVSNPVAPALIGLGVEYGSILQNTTGNTTTLRANLLGVSRMVLGSEQFPYCPVIDQAGCTPVSRWLRRLSATTSFENTNQTIGTGTAAPVTTLAPTPVDLFGNGFRMASWGARLDITANDPSDAGFVDRFKGAIETLRVKQAVSDLSQSIGDLFGDTAPDAVYVKWQAETLSVLKSASKDQFKKTLAQQLDSLMDQSLAANSDFIPKIAAIRRSSQNYFFERDTLLQQIQSHQFSVEYTNLHALNQPTTSNVRFIYSDQPSVTPLLITANAAITWYNSVPTGVTTGRLRDVQAAAKIDRRLGVIPNLGNAVLTIGGYYQWMKDDALIEIGPGNVAPGSGIVLPGTAATLLGTKGNIGIVQGRVTLPIGSTIKVPLSLTWSNRTELIKESDTRGQIGVTFDVGSLFR